MSTGSLVEIRTSKAQHGCVIYSVLHGVEAWCLTGDTRCGDRKSYWWYTLWKHDMVIYDVEAWRLMVIHGVEAWRQTYWWCTVWRYDVLRWYTVWRHEVLLVIHCVEQWSLTGDTQCGNPKSYWSGRCRRNRVEKKIPDIYSILTVFEIHFLTEWKQFCLANSS